ncbi:MAG: type IV toxin-antitoxin system AbiEi family antitoxin domain-containing protein [Pseudomonadota bacterium]
MTATGLSADSRRQLSRLLRGSPPIVTTSQAASTLGLPANVAACRLAAWSRSGWLARVRRGAYVPVPIESESADVALDDSWAVAAAMFSPCYVGGWSAAEHWGLTEQVFRSTCVMTATRPRHRQFELRKARFELHTVAAEQFFGLKTLWRGGTRVQVSDPARTLTQMLGDPALGGGIRHVADMLMNLLRDRPKDAGKLFAYAAEAGNGAVFKRLGYLLQRDQRDQTALLEACRANLSSGYAKLDPALPADRLVTAWRVWVPFGEVGTASRLLGRR